MLTRRRRRLLSVREQGFATSISIVISCVASYFLFHFEVNTRFLVGASLGQLRVSSQAFPRPSQPTAMPHALTVTPPRAHWGLWRSAVLYAVFLYSSTPRVEPKPGQQLPSSAAYGGSHHQRAHH